MKYLSHTAQPPLLNQLAFYTLLGSGAYIILLWSPNILGGHVGFWTQILIYIFPWLMLWVSYSWQVLAEKEHRLEIILIVSIIILGVANTSLSNSGSRSIDTMRTFLLTGLFALWAAMFLVNNPRRRQMFDWFCAGALGIIILVEMISYVVSRKYGLGVFQVFILHPIPLGTLIILLSSGPVRLIISKNSTAKLLGWLLVLLSGSLIFLTHKRGTWIALAAMLAVWMLYLVRRRRYLVISIILVIALISSLEAQRRFARLDPNIGRHAAILHRVELYHFALHIWKTHPFMGIGLRSFTHENYLPDYHLRNQALREFPQAVASLQTLDNLFLTSLVELGAVMTLFYLGLILLILAKYCRRVQSRPESSPLDWYRGLIVLGFAIHSLTYDSLLFPPLNWLFHVQVGIMAGYQAYHARLSHQPGAMGLSEA
jgi:O-antigen ligase